MMNLKMLLIWYCMCLAHLGFEDFTAQVSLRDKENKEKYIGSDSSWERS